jgi:hypothetical protein
MTHFRQFAVADFEYEIPDGELPRVLCLVVYLLSERLEYVRTIRLWRGEFGTAPPFDIGPDTLFVAYTAWAELTCFTVLGWKFPHHIFDLHTAFLAADNMLPPTRFNDEEERKRDPKNLETACAKYACGADWGEIDKRQIAKDIGEGNWHKYGKEGVLDYCEFDVANEVKLFRAMLREHRNAHGALIFPAANVPDVLRWSEYSAKCCALIQARGMLIDMPMWNEVQEQSFAVTSALVRKFDPSQGITESPVYVREGDHFRFSQRNFERFLPHLGIYAWPRLDSGALSLDSDAFKLFHHVRGIEDLHALHDSLRVIASAKLPIGSDGRNRPSLFPFGARTGRNAHCKSLYNAHAGLRSFLVPPPGKRLVSLDWRTQEVGIAAVIFDDATQRADYRSGDVYHALARLLGLTADDDRKRWARDHADVRQRMKALQLGINYLMGVKSISTRIERHPLVAAEILRMHRARYPRLYAGRQEAIELAMLRREIRARNNWPLRISFSPNERTLANFPCQANGAAMLQVATVRLVRAGIVPVMLVHDGILLEIDEDHAQEQEALAIEIMQAASRDVLGGFQVDADVDQRVLAGQRYVDKRPVSKRMWQTIVDTLEITRGLKTGS